MKSKEELKKLFENGDKPTQEEFWEWQDSYWHKDEKLPIENTSNDSIPLTGTKTDKPITGPLVTESTLAVGKGKYTLIETADGSIDDDQGAMTINHKEEFRLNIGSPITGEIKSLSFNANGLAARDIFMPTSDFDFVQKKYVDSKISFNNITLNHSMSGTAHYSTIGGYGFLRLKLSGTATAGGKNLDDGNNGGFGDFTKIIPVRATSDNSIKFIRLNAVNGGHGLRLSKASAADNDFDFILDEVLAITYLGQVFD